MDSTSESSYFDRSNTQETETSSSHRHTRKDKGKKADFWDVHAPFGDISKGQDPTIHYYVYCQEYSSNIATNMQRHIKNVHNITIESAPNAIRTIAIVTLHQLYT